MEVGTSGERTARVDLDGLRAMGWITIVAGAWFVYDVASDGEYGGAAVIAGLFGLGGTYMIALAGPIEIGPHAIRSTNKLGVWEMAWDEIESLEVDPFDRALSFSGSGKQLPIAGPKHWHGPQRGLFRTLLDHQVERRDIERIHTQAAIWRLPRGTRVRIAPGTDLPRIAP